MRRNPLSRMNPGGALNRPLIGEEGRQGFAGATFDNMGKGGGVERWLGADR